MSSGENSRVLEVHEHGPLLDDAIDMYNHLLEGDGHAQMTAAVEELSARTAELGKAEYVHLPEYNTAPRSLHVELGAEALRAAVFSQAEAEKTYEFTIEPARSDEHLSRTEVAQRLETDHVVKVAPEFTTQIWEKDRTNPITSVAGYQYGLGTRTSNPRFAEQQVTRSEHEVLRKTHMYLQAAVHESSVLSPEQVNKARAMRDSLTFIGKKEYDEAARGIAEYWTAALEENPHLQILAIAGKIGDQYAEADGPREIKSDEYLLDSVLDYFSDDDMEKYAGRLITDPSRITVEDHQNLKAVLLDDRAISGAQLADARESFVRDHPALAPSLEVQLVVANRKRITEGLVYKDQLPTPVRAYYLAHHSDWAPDGDAHILAEYGASDYGVEDVWEDITTTAKKAGTALDPEFSILLEMPAAANIVRPFRKEGFRLTNKARLESHAVI